MFLKNTWYVAARSDEIGASLKPMTILGEKIVFYRQENGDPVALEDACPHRKLPLSMGRLEGDLVVCGYHGLTFDCTGSCVASPTQKRIPSPARVRSYPVAERWGLIWIWMGDVEKADPATIFTIENADNPSWGLTQGGTLACTCNYLYLTDNLLDPSHVAWVHVTSFAAKGTEDTPLQITMKDDGVTVWRWMKDREVPPYYAPLVKFKGNCDRLQHYEVRYPGIGVNMSIYTPAGQGGDINNLPPDTYIMVSYHFMTPIDDTHTQYIWMQQRNTDPHDAKVSEQISAGAKMAFEEDRVVLEAVQLGMDNKITPHLDLELDAGALRFRRGLQTLIERENAAPAAAK